MALKTCKSKHLDSSRCLDPDLPCKGKNAKLKDETHALPIKRHRKDHVGVKSKLSKKENHIVQDIAPTKPPTKKFFYIPKAKGKAPSLLKAKPWEDWEPTMPPSPPPPTKLDEVSTKPIWSIWD